LTYTDLVHPTRTILVKDGSTFTSYPNYGICRSKNCTPEEHYIDRFHRCKHDRAMGFCKKVHPMATFDCPCWIPPTYLFCVCQSIYEKAQITFFTMNRFEIY